MTTEKQVADRAFELYGEDFQGMTITNGTMTIGIGNKDIVIKDFAHKGLKEIFEKIENDSKEENK
ncbi:hypothetical protein IJE86_02250 [bacterium]|nr:hypothetical protein [bacterium]